MLGAKALGSGVIGGGSESAPQIPIPTVNAGPDLNATDGETITLSGATASDYDSLQWTCESGQSPTFSDATALNPDVTFNESGLHVLRLTATNAENSSFDEIEVNVAEGVISMPHVIGGFKNLSIPEEGNDGWLNPILEGPIALFDANFLAEDLATNSNGIMSFTTSYNVRELVGSTGEYGWRFRMPAAEFPDSNGLGGEKRYKFSRPLKHCWEVVRIWQPENYYNRYIVAAFSAEDISVVSDWQEGDTVSTGTGTATYVSSKLQGEVGSQEAKHFFKDLSDGDTVVFVDGETVTNTRTGGSFTIDRALFIATNKKLFSMWINDGIHKQPSGYSQSGMFFEISADYDYEGKTTPKFNYLSSIPSDEGSSGAIPNEITPLNPYVFDTADNGSFVTFVVERKRSDTATSGGAIARMWKKTERVGSDTEDLTLIYETTDGQQFHSEEHNGFNAGYLFGTTNGGYTEQTDFYLNKYELYEAKPQILTDAGF